MTASASEALKAAATGKEIAKQEPPRDFPAMLTQWKGEIARALPKHLNADRMARIALTCFRSTPKLAECDPRSVFAAVIQAAQLGIEPGLMGEAYLIPYKATCQLIPGYMGLIKLAKQTGQVTDIYAMAVREKDRFSCSFGLQRTLEHTPLPGPGGFPAPVKARGEIIGFYAVAVFKDGARTFVIMGRDQVEEIRNNSSGYQMAVKYRKDSPWTTHFEEMGSKTVIRRLCKTLPKSPELAAAMAMDDAHHAGKPQNIDLTEAIEGNYTPVNEDGAEAETIDPETGEIAPEPTAVPAQEAPRPSARRPAAAPAQKSPEPQPAAQEERPVIRGGEQPVATSAAPRQGQNAPTIKDALNLINKADYGAALDLVGGRDFTEIDRSEIRAAIKRHQEGELV